MAKKKKKKRAPNQESKQVKPGNLVHCTKPEGVIGQDYGQD